MRRKVLYFALYAAAFAWFGKDGQAQNPPVNATQLRGRNISTTAPTNGQVYVWNASTGFWTPGASSGGGVTSVTGTANQVCVATGTTTPVLSICTALDLSGLTSTKPIKSGTSLPATCGVGEFYDKTDATAGSNLYSCTATNTWTVVGGGGGATIPSVTNLIKGNGSGNGADSGIAATAVGIAGSLSSLGWYNATSNGMVCNDSTDDTTAFNALLGTVNTAGGGTIWLPGICKIAGAVVFPNDGLTIPTQHPIRITGCGSNGSSYSPGTTQPTGLCGLDLVYNAAVAKLDTRGSGLLEIDHISLLDRTGGDAASFIQTTNTALRLHDVFFYGGGGGSNNIAVVLGGSGSTSNGTATALFQGYGTVIDNNVFDNMETAVAFMSAANGVQVVNNTITNRSGGTAVFDLTSTSQQARGNTISGNLIELTHYVQAVLCGANCLGNVFIGNQTWDPNGTITVASYTMTSSTGNVIISGHDDTGAKSGWVNILNPGTANYVLASIGNGSPNYPQPFGATFYNDGSVLATTNSAPFTLPFPCTIQGWNASVAPSGTATFKVWKIATGTAIPTVSNSINTSGVGVSTGTSVKSTALSDFTATTVAANDIVIISMTAVTGSPTSATFGVQCQ